MPDYKSSIKPLPLKPVLSVDAWRPDENKWLGYSMNLDFNPDISLDGKVMTFDELVTAVTANHVKDAWETPDHFDGDLHWFDDKIIDIHLYGGEIIAMKILSRSTP